MEEEMGTLKKNSTWNNLQYNIQSGTNGVFTFKYNFDGSIAHYKAWLVTKGYT